MTTQDTTTTQVEEQHFNTVETESNTGTESNMDIDFRVQHAERTCKILQAQNAQQQQQIRQLQKMVNELAKRLDSASEWAGQTTKKVRELDEVLTLVPASEAFTE